MGSLWDDMMEDHANRMRGGSAEKPPKERAFAGTPYDCNSFVRANRFSALLSSLEIRGNEVWAYRNDK